jgi:hypothetical protein
MRSTKPRDFRSNGDAPHALTPSAGILVPRIKELLLRGSGTGERDASPQPD